MNQERAHHCRECLDLGLVHARRRVRRAEPPFGEHLGGDVAAGEPQRREQPAVARERTVFRPPIHVRLVADREGVAVAVELEERILYHGEQPPASREPQRAAVVAGAEARVLRAGDVGVADRVGERGIEHRDVVHVIAGGAAARHEELLGHESPGGTQLVDDVHAIRPHRPTVGDRGARRCTGRPG